MGTENSVCYPSVCRVRRLYFLSEYYYILTNYIMVYGTVFQQHFFILSILGIFRGIECDVRNTILVPTEGKTLL